ncbi:hypothetical protein [Nocardioides sp. Root190]|uniref:hypothetical protein n=1 Tax=Nocardioides sp. Root190 TaxID=1736488 RepID=UPI000B14D840|nr:hypothetical protein [Nocardioides sp. Root190]
MKTPPVVEGHRVTVTPVGPRHVTECSCGLPVRRFASKRAANDSGIAHLEALQRGESS